MEPSQGRRSAAGGIGFVAAALLSVALLAFAMMFFIRSGDAMILIFGVIASAIPIGVAFSLRSLSGSASVAVRCPACTHLNPETARFCNACGKAL